jgi:chemotaxis protein MotB
MALPEPDSPPGVPEWVVTYGDMMSLLLTFFIMLVSLSELKNDDGKMRAALDAIRESFGPSFGRFSAPGDSSQRTSILDAPGSEGATSEGGLKEAGRLSAGAAGEHVTVERINHGTRITLGGPATFGRFSAELTPAMKQNLLAIAAELAGVSTAIVVRGHAAREPLPPGGLPAGSRDSETVLGRPPRDKLDLSFARAAAAADFLIECGIDPHRLRISAAGDSEPRRPGRQEDGQAVNRRVDVFSIDGYITEDEPAGEP